MDLTLRHRLAVLVALPALAIAVVGGIGVAGLVLSANANQGFMVMASALSDHQHGAMMHDALRADALAALRLGGDTAAAGRDDIIRQAAGHAGGYRAAIAANRERTLPADVGGALAGLAEPLDRYIRSAEHLVATAVSDPAAASALLADFQAAYADLKQRRQDVSGRIVGHRDQQAAASARTSRWATLAALGVMGMALAGSLVIALLAMRAITRPLVRAADAIGRICAGARDQSLDYRVNDEIGAITRAVLTMQDQARRLDASEAEERQRLRQDSERAVRMDRAVADFQVGMARALTRVEDADTDLRGIASTLRLASADASARSGAVSQAADQTAAAVETVATATESLLGSIAEIGQRTTEAAEISGAAALRVEMASERIQALHQAAGRIADIISLIAGIAGQTNLLAMNATIEAAHAGESGRGFAVVAGEVRKLASQTAHATDGIRAQIAAIRAETGDAVDAVCAVTQSVAHVQEIAAAIAVAVESQTGTTARIARTMTETAAATRAVTVHLGAMARTVSATEQAAGALGNATDGVAQEMTQLRSQVAGFIATAAAAAA